MFEVSKIIGAVIDPTALIAICLLLGISLYASGRPFFQNIGKVVILVTSLLFASLAIFPVGSWAIAPLENLFASVGLPQKVDGILLLTGDENVRVSESRDKAVGGSATQRYVHLASLVRKYPEAKIVIVGTTVPSFGGEQWTTKTVSIGLLDSVGVPYDRVLFEEKSRTTRENAVFAYEMIKPLPTENWVLVTSGYHMPRSVLSFAKAGWRVIPSISDYFTTGKDNLGIYHRMNTNLRLLSLAAHEYYGLVSYWLLKWIDRPWP